MSKNNDVPRFDDTIVVARITRYSELRGVERALLPPVRSRRSLPTAHMIGELLQQLKKLQEPMRRSTAPSEAEVKAIGVELEDVDAALDEFAQRLVATVRQTPLVQLRSTLPEVVERSRGDVASLLDLCLEHFSVRDDGEPPHLLDYVITSLSRCRTNGVSLLRVDPSRITPGMMRRCDARDGPEDEVSAGFARAFRNAAIELLELDDLEKIIGQVRSTKGQLGERLFDREVVRALVDYNIAAENRFRELIELHEQQDRDLQRTLDALAHVDALRAEDAPRVNGGPESALRSPGVRALEAALRERLRGASPDGSAAAEAALRIDLSDLEETDVATLLNPNPARGSTLTRAAVVVGLALRQLPTLDERLGDLDIDVMRMREDWVRDLDAALQASIHTLEQSGQRGRAADLAHTRMKFLSGA